MLRKKVIPEAVPNLADKEAPVRSIPPSNLNALDYNEPHLVAGSYLNVKNTHDCHVTELSKDESVSKTLKIWSAQPLPLVSDA